MIIGQNFDASILVDADAVVSGSQIDPDHGFVFWLNLFRLLRVRETSVRQEDGKEGVTEEKNGDRSHCGGETTAGNGAASLHSDVDSVGVEQGRIHDSIGHVHVTLQEGLSVRRSVGIAFFFHCEHFENEE